MKVLTVVGTRPEIIRLSQIIPKLDSACQQALVNTRQNFDTNLNDVFFKGFDLRPPNYSMDNHSALYSWIGQTESELAAIIEKEKPDRMLILGDTNTALASAFVAARSGIPVYHMESGNRSFDKAMPEEVNRKIIDACSDILMPYTENSRGNLLRENVPSNRIYVTGNPIWEVLATNNKETDILKSLNLNAHLGDRAKFLMLHGSDCTKSYFLVTAHRQENVDNPDRLRNIIMACSRLNMEYDIPVIFSCHPRTAKRIKDAGIGLEGITIHEPFSFHDFVTLEKNALCVLTDSGTVQEECCLLYTPCVTIRDTTERPETVECGSNILAGVDPGTILRCVKTVLSQGTEWSPSPEYLKTNVSDTVVKIVTAY